MTLHKFLMKQNDYRKIQTAIPLHLQNKWINDSPTQALNKEAPWLRIDGHSPYALNWEYI